MVDWKKNSGKEVRDYAGAARAILGIKLYEELEDIGVLAKWMELPKYSCLREEM